MGWKYHHLIDNSLWADRYIHSLFSKIHQNYLIDNECSVHQCQAILNSCKNEQDAYEVLAQIARNRKCVLKGDEPDIRKAAALLLDDFRSGRIGRITLESQTEQA